MREPNPIYRIEAQVDELYRAGWRGPYVAILSPDTKDALDAALDAVRSTATEAPIPMRVDAFETRCGTVRLTVNRWKGPGDSVLVQARGGRHAR